MSEVISARNAYGEALREIGVDERIVVLDADVSTCTMSCMFGEVYPERFFNVGIAEANMVCMAAGMSTFGFKPFVHSFAMFVAGRAFEQIRNSVAYPGLDVKIVGTHAGLTVGEDGATHQCLEDIALMRSIPGMTVIAPADAHETKLAVRKLKDHIGPAYLRISRSEVSTVTNVEGYKFEIGKAVKLREGEDATIAATGITVKMALDAAEKLQKEGISVRVLNFHTIKPLDEEAVISAANDTGAIVTVEEHNVMGGFGSAICEAVAEGNDAIVCRTGVSDVFGRSGNPIKLLEHYGVSSTALVENVKKAIRKKNNRYKTETI